MSVEPMRGQPEMTKPADWPHHLTCDGCGKPLNSLTSYGLTVPLTGKSRPADFCGLLCLARWATERARWA